MRLVLIETKLNRYTVYEGRKPLESWVPEDGIPLEPKHVEDLRVDNYDEKA